mmetsp:Transcript_9468/g.15744  ORF Transcript_9468/g.15744 Transcript_9468/m.15744 type:complete len:187 (-) Transcript_9468:101-661(-)|eukprot:CAMPEP_0119012488 /NCGR_PEP_ID=MMETSP1176-20130426/6799_1 /TAXON_ID=265551 /ORGANISM="Synedropsis recta cf, Strain CCMP1620" /LENGTH=186 /DNA_ID=CAMNT_0006965455 /DNA_START=60 /DNA_END=620 /DNA_ORIENTATION=+
MKRLLVLLLPLLFPDFIQAAEEQEDATSKVTTEFLDACVHGKIDVIKASLAEHPTWLNGRSENGETCMHVAGIEGQAAVSHYLLQQGADVNIRSSFEGGLRMHPLSWNVYGGHYENIEVLVGAGKADVNLDYDDSKGNAITSLDTVLQILASDDGKIGDEADPYFEKFYKIKELLLKNGAKQYKDL